MTFGELCKQTARECGEGISYEQAQNILATQWRIMLEELFIAPDEAEIMFTGIGRFFLSRRMINCGIFKDGNLLGHEKRPAYCFVFKPSPILRSAMAGKIRMMDLKIGGVPLYQNDRKSLKRPQNEFAEGDQALKEMLEQRIRYDRAELRMAKERKANRDIDNRLPED